MAAIVDFVCVRIESEINRYMKTNALPQSLLEGEFSVKEILHCIDTCDRFTDEQKIAAKRLIKEYDVFIDQNFSEIKHNFKQDYVKLLDGLETDSDDFKFNIVMKKYRNSINPVAALYYETKQILYSFNPENDCHIWLLSTITDPVFIIKLITAIDNDIAKLEKIIRCYEHAMMYDETKISLEMFHCKNLMDDLKIYKQAFQLANIWGDE